MSASVRARKRQPFISGFCAYAPTHTKCRGEYKNGSLVRPLVTLCSCSCHGNYPERLIAAGQELLTDDVEEVDDEDD